MVESAAVWMIGIGFVGVFVGAGQTAAWMSGRYNRMKERLEETELQRDQESQSLLQVQDELAQAQTENTRLQAQLEAERASTADKIKTLTEAREQLANQFRTLSQEVLEEKSKRFTEQNQASLKPLLDPLREHIGRFEKQVKQAYDEENRQRSALSEQIKLLQETNRHISEDATNLANALRGESKTQGNWGEMILETVLEQSGLEKGVQYDTQFATTTEDGKRRLPDAVVHLPGERSIVIDSKVSLTAYVQVHEADSEEGRRQALDAHLASVRNHLKELSDKDYQALPDINTLDYVFMFIPSEAAYVEALRGDFALQRNALDKNIALVSPTTLMPMLRAVSNLWRLQQQEENAADIAHRAGLLYDKFVGFLDDLDKLGRAMDTADKAYTDARKKLVDGRGNLVRRTQELKELGARTAKSIDTNWSSAAELGAQRSDAPADADDDASSD